MSDEIEKQPEAPTEPATPTDDKPESKANAAFARARLAEKQALKRAEEAERKLAEIERSKLSDEEKLKADFAALKPKAEQVERYTSGIGKILELEMNEIPEDKRDLVPNLDPLEKLEWVRSAKQKGIFKAPTAPSPEKKPGTSNGAPAPGNGAGEADARLRAEIDKAVKSGNPKAIAAAMRKAK